MLSSLLQLSSDSSSSTGGSSSSSSSESSVQGCQNGCAIGVTVGGRFCLMLTKCQITLMFVCSMRSMIILHHAISFSAALLH